jgi:hypothetical protein
MRYFATFVAIIAATMTFGQTSDIATDSVAVSRPVFDATSGIATGDNVTIEGTSYEVLETEKGSRYVMLTSSRTGNAYALWIGTPTAEQFDGRTIYEFESGSKCVYIMGKTGNPYSKWLSEEDFATN